VLAGNVTPTEASGDLGAYGRYLREPRQGGGGGGPGPGGRPWAVTEDNILGPFHRPGAPYRAKITPPMEPGVVMLIRGRVYGFDTRRPLAGAVLDVWQASANGRYDNDDPKRPPAADVFTNRARLITDENGFYEFETIKPGAYRIDKTTWRPNHIHFWIRHTAYRPLVTQLYFRGDEHQKGDPWIKESLIIELRDQKTPGGQAYKTGTFDIVLAPVKG
jgi:protocatechuate 3,4-dioxygenase beta subunit